MVPSVGTNLELMTTQTDQLFQILPVTECQPGLKSGMSSRPVDVVAPLYPHCEPAQTLTGEQHQTENKNSHFPIYTDTRI